MKNCKLLVIFLLLLFTILLSVKGVTFFLQVLTSTEAKDYICIPVLTK